MEPPLDESRCKMTCSSHSSKDKLLKENHLFFSFTKSSKARRKNSIRGEAVYPMLEDKKEDIATGEFTSLQTTMGFTLQIWIEIYGEIQRDMDEEAVIDKVDRAIMGTGTYLVMAAKQEGSKMLPVFGQMVTLSYDGSSKV
jgi:hypothetical protein